MHILLIYATLFQRLNQVAHVNRKMMFGDTSSMVDMAKRFPRIGGRTIQGCTEEFALHASDFIHGRVLKKRFQLRIGHDAVIEFTDQVRDSRIATDPFMQGVLFVDPV